MGRIGLGEGGCSANVCAMGDGPIELLRAVRALVDEYRERCLWFLPVGYYPETPDEVLRTLDRIERHGDLRAFREAARLRRWLSRSSSETSAA